MIVTNSRCAKIEDNDTEHLSVVQKLKMQQK